MSSYWHECPKCYRGYEGRRKICLGKKTMETLHAQTMERLWKLENEQGYEVHAVWECDFRQQLKKDSELRRMYEECNIPGHLDPREHCLRGGRTEPFRFHYQCKDDEEILLLDIVSFWSIFDLL